MTVEIKEMVVRTTISGNTGDSMEDAGGCNSMEEVKQEVLAVCMERLADFLARQKDR